MESIIANQQQVSNNVTTKLHDWHPASSGIVDGTNDHNIFAPDAPWPDLPLFASLVRRSMVHFAHLKKSIHCAPDLMGEQGDVDGVVRARLIAGLDGALELFIPGPCNTNVRRRLLAELRGVTRLSEGIALTSSRRLE